MGDFLSYIFAWYNVWFTAPIAFVFLIAIFQLVIGGLDFGGGEADVEVDVDADVNVDVDTDVDVDADTDIDTNSESGGGSFVANVLGVLNVGKVPFILILISLFSIWGISGLVVNGLLNIETDPRLGMNQQSALGISLAFAFLCSILGTRYLALGISKLLPESEPPLTDKDLIGLTGRVISGRITTTFGTARVRAPNGTELTVSCRVCEGEDVPLKGDAVILVDYNSTTRIFDVTKVDSAFAS